MAMYRLGSRGDEVALIQRKLAQRDLYGAPPDGEFGGATLSAVTAFQRARGLQPDGIVGPQTWKDLCDSEIPAPAIAREGLARRCLALTGAFETDCGFPECFCRIGGDFDGQGISFGVLQWNFGQHSLQPLLSEMVERHPDVSAQVFGPQLEPLRRALSADHEDLMAFARSVQHPVHHTVYEPWRGLARALGRTAEFQAIQVRHAADRFARAGELCDAFGLASERATALMFDILVQNGGIGTVVRAQIQADASRLPRGLAQDEREVRTMEIVANRRAEAADPRWIDDVRSRKLCIARGQGTVHGIAYDLHEQFGIGLRPFTG